MLNVLFIICKDAEMQDNKKCSENGALSGTGLLHRQLEYEVLV